MKIVGVQGDLIIFSVDQIPKGLKKREGNVLVYGEVTHHAHRVNNADIWEQGDDLYVQPFSSTIIEHEEHNPIPLEAPGVYRISRQREYQSEDMTKLVID